MMDYWVQQGQVWLNKTYENVPGFVRAPTTGQTGWSTMYSLTRALQHELGITTLSDNFGAQTFAALSTNIGSVTSATDNQNVVGILQVAFWCKGYLGGYSFGTWDDDVSSSVANVRTNLGLTSGQTVPPKVFKSILTMDAYIRIGSGTDQTRQVQQWLNGRYLARLDYSLVPCDGSYSRQVQKGLLFAIQYEVGLADGTANGSFGPATQSGIKAYGVFALGATDSTRKMVQLFQAALIVNGYALPFNGIFDVSTQTPMRAFQAFMELGVTTSTTYGTWASLLVSSGDPTRPVTACDTRTPLTAGTAQMLYAGGYRAVGRYVNGGVDKRLTHTEAEVIWSAGMTWFPIYQEFNNESGEFSSSKGDLQGQRMALRLRQLGIRSGNRAFLGIDFDATDADIDAVVVPHMRAVSFAMEASKSVRHELGTYGTRNVCSRLADESLTAASFVSDMSTGYSGNLGFPMPANWAYDQIVEIPVGTAPNNTKIDRDAASVRATSLTRSDVVRTPRRYVGSNPVGFDEECYWRWSALTYRIEASGAALDQFILNELLLTRLQKPNYWPPNGTAGLIWTAITPPIWERVAGPTSLTESIITASDDFDRAAGGEVYPLPVGGRFGDTPHFAASTRGYTAWGVPDAGNTDVNNGDLAAWALDLAQAWNIYELERLKTPDGVLPVRSWFAANVGILEIDEFFGPSDLRADMAAFLCAKRMRADANRPLDDIIREMLVAIEDNPGWLAQRFFAERFVDRETLERVARTVLSGGWSLVSFAAGLFMGDRKPGQASAVRSPSETVLNAEVQNAAEGFADAIELAKSWTVR